MWKAAVVGAKPPFGRIANVAKLRDRVQIVAVCDLNEDWAKDEAPASEYVHVEPQAEDDSVVQHQNFLDALDEDRDPSPNMVDGYRAIQVALAMQESARTGARVEIAT